MPVPIMNPPDKGQERPKLALHLGVVLALKFALLALLWYLLVMPYRVEIDAPAMGERLTQASPQSNTRYPLQSELCNGAIQGAMGGGIPPYRNRVQGAGI